MNRDLSAVAQASKESKSAVSREYDRYVTRHGEFWVQNIVECIERSEGIRPGYGVPLEQRWYAVMQISPVHQPLEAA
jgi:hypothetical protein